MSSRDDEYTEYISARMMSLRRTAYMLCQDWHRADDLVQAAITKLYVHWGRARAADHIDAYARTVLVHEFLGERRSAWARRVSLDGRVTPKPGSRHDAADARRAARRAQRQKKETQAADHIDAYARTVLVREFLGERRSAWARRVSLHGQLTRAGTMKPPTTTPCSICVPRSPRCRPASGPRSSCGSTAT